MKPIREKERKLMEPVMRFLNSTMARVSPDSQGRITLPKELVEYADIREAAVVVGCGDYAEIWSEEADEKLKAELDVSKLLEELEKLGL